MRPVVYAATSTDVSNGYTVSIPVDYLKIGGQYGVQYLNSSYSAGSGTVQMSLDDPFNPPATVTWTNISLIANQAQINGTVRAFRINSPSLGDILTVVPQGDR